MQLDIRYGLDEEIKERTKSQITSCLLVRLVEWRKSLVTKMKRMGSRGEFGRRESVSLHPDTLTVHMVMFPNCLTIYENQICFVLFFFFV